MRLWGTSAASAPAECASARQEDDGAGAGGWDSARAAHADALELGMQRLMERPLDASPVPFSKDTVLRGVHFASCQRDSIITLHITVHALLRRAQPWHCWTWRCDRGRTRSRLQAGELSCRPSPRRRRGLSAGCCAATATTGWR